MKAIAPILFSILFSTLLLFNNPSAQVLPETAQCDVVYAVHDQAIEDSQIFAYHLNQGQFEVIGGLQIGLDLEGLDLHPQQQVLYASSGQPNARLYTVDAVSGALGLVGEIGFDNVTSLAFHPNGQLWAGADQGLLQIDVATGRGSLVEAQLPDSQPIDSLAWDGDGLRLYATTSDSVTRSQLWVYDVNQQWQLACDDLPAKVESLETLPDGKLIYAFHQDASLGIHHFDVATCQTLADAQLETPYNDIEGLAWPVQGCTTSTPSNEEALRAYLQSLPGMESVDIQSGKIEVLLNGERHHGELAATVTAGTPVAELSMIAIDDQNGDGIGDFYVTYPSGDQQVLYYYGVIVATPDACKTLVVPTIDPTVISVPSLVSQFLYSGSNPIQVGVAADTIDLEHAATLRGKVTDAAGEPLTNVSITIKDHAEYGETVTICDGVFNMAVNGGGTLTVNYHKIGYLPVQRKVTTTWQQYAVVDDVVMRELDPQVSKIDLTANTLQVAQGSMVTDEDGSRQAVVLFSAGISATMTLADGSTQPLTELDVRATEYTVGENGPEAMPGPLPAASGYTYAVDLSVDQALAVGATRVDFSQPVPLYVDNFLNFPVGGIVPVGWYDYNRGVWVPSDNGRVIGIIGIENGLAVLDVDGSGQAANAAALAELGITDEERQQLANQYAVGKSLWRSPIAHFTPWDCNWPRTTPDDAERHSAGEPTAGDENKVDKPECENGCIIEAENQILGESVDVVGTPFSLNYRSNRVLGYKAAYTLHIPLRGDAVPNSLKEIVLEMSIAGKHFEQRFPPATRETTFVWDGLDVFGRQIKGVRVVYVRIGYVYDAVYVEPAELEQSFARLGSEPITGNRAREEVILWKEYEKELGAWTSTKTELGSFNLNVHHVYDVVGQVLYQGNGQQRSVERLISSGVIETVVGDGDRNWSSNDEGQLATEVSIYPSGIAFDNHDNLYIVDSVNHRVYKVDSYGVIHTVAGNGNPAYSGDGGLATEAELRYPYDIAFAPDGSLYIADSGNKRIRKVDSNGIIHTVVGVGSSGSYDDDVLATEAQLDWPVSISFDLDGNLYIADRNAHKIRQVNTSGIISTVAGTGSYSLHYSVDYDGDGLLATDTRISTPIVVIPDTHGNLYITESVCNCIRQVDTNGIIHTVAGLIGNTGSCSERSGDGVLASEVCLRGPTGLAFKVDGSLYFAEKASQSVRLMNTTGFISTLAGNGDAGFYGDGGLAIAARLNYPGDVAVDSQDNLYIADNNNARIRRVSSTMPEFSVATVLVPSENGSLLYAFDTNGRHLHTTDTITGQHLYTFSYSDNGYLVAIEDLDGDITRIERNGDTPVAIIAPDGQRTNLTVNADGYLSSITNPAGETHQFSYTEDGLLTEFTNPRGHQSTYRYDESGLLVEDINPAGGGWDITRTEYEEGGHTVTMSSKEGRASQYQVKPQSTGDMLRVQIASDGTKTQTLEKVNGETELTYANGTQVVSKQAPDPRFGMQAPYAERITITTPQGLSREVNTEKTVELLDENNPLSLDTLITKVISNGRTRTHIYNVTDKKATITTAANRTVTAFFDDKGRIIQDDVSGFVSIYYQYDQHGRLITLTKGTGNLARTTQFGYDNNGYLTQLIDPLNRSVNFTYDTAGRIVGQTLPGELQIHYGYDANGNLTSLTPPSRPAHTFAYSKVDLNNLYMPPTLSDIAQPQTQYVYNLDKQLTHIHKSDGQVIEYVYDLTKERITHLALPNNQRIGYHYDDNTGQLITMTGVDGSALNYTYDGDLVLSNTWTNGEVNGSVTFDYNNDFQLVALSISGQAINYQYDNDDLLTQVGKLNLTRNSDNGLLAQAQLGTFNYQYTYNLFAETDQKTVSDGDQIHYETQYQYDKLGRITQVVETVEGITSTYVYRYDLAGRLDEVKQDNVIVEMYSYDDNGNRLTAQGITTTRYDDQDRLMQYGNNTYAYTDNGELHRKENNGQITEYNYDVLGNLRSVQLPNGRQIEYVIDARDRRIGKKVNGQLVQGFLYQDDLNPVAELDANGSMIARFVYGTKNNVPDYMVKAGKTYLIVSNHLGSPRLVIDADNSTVVQRIDYDTFGNVVFDSNPGFQPFGFAGGIYDTDTNLTRFGARDYDAEIGRWTAKDLILFEGGDANLYGYVLNDPINAIDPLGLCKYGCVSTGPSKAPDTKMTYDSSGRKWCNYRCRSEETNEQKSFDGPGHGEYCIGQSGGDEYSPAVNFDDFSHNTDSWWDSLPLEPFTNGPDFDEAIRDAFGEK